MCIPLIAKAVSIRDSQVDLELVGGERVRADGSLHPELAVDDYVLLDRGLVIEVIDAEQAESMLAFYAELENLWAEEGVSDG